MAVAADPAPNPSRHAAGRESEGHAQAAPTQAGFGHWQGGQSHENPNGHQPYGSNGHEAPGGQRQADHASPSSGGRRGWLGVSLQPITVPDNLVHRAGQATARQVVAVTKGGPADRAGLRGGDVLLAVDRTPTTGNYALRSFLAPDRVGSQVELRVMRDGLLHTAMLTIEPQPEP
jgi:membrane-associated protease RseP (regulator of RpoE activity)